MENYNPNELTQGNDLDNAADLGQGTDEKTDAADNTDKSLEDRVSTLENQVEKLRAHNKRHFGPNSEALTE